MASPKDQIAGYIAPSPEAKAARKRRNYAIAGALLAFVVFIFLLMVSKIGAAGA